MYEGCMVELQAGGTFFWLEDRYEDLNTYVQTKNLIQDR